MLQQICAAADRADEYAQAIGRDGLTIRTATGIKDHPCCGTKPPRSTTRIRAEV